MKYATEISLFSLITLENVDDLFGDKNAIVKQKVMPEVLKYLTLRSKSVLMPILHGVARESIKVFSLKDRIETCDTIRQKIADKFQVIPIFN